MRKITILIIAGCLLLGVLFGVYVLIRVRVLSSRVAETRTNPISPSSPAPTIQTQSNDGIDSPFDAALFEAEKKYEQEERPDVIVTNNTPYSNDAFDAYTESVTEVSRGYFRVMIYGKNAQTQQVIQQEVRKWLLSLDIPEASIPKLNIEYREQAIPTVHLDL